MKIIGRIFLIFSCVLAGLFLWFYIDTTFLVPRPHAHPYRVVAADDYSHPGHKRVAWHVLAPDAMLSQDRAATVFNAALKLHEETQADEVTIWLQPDEDLIGDGYPLAKVDALPARNEFKIAVSDLILSAHQIEILTALKSLRPQFTRGTEFDDVGLYREVRHRFGLSDNYPFPQPMLAPFSVSKIDILGGKDPRSILNPASFSSN